MAAIAGMVDMTGMTATMLRPPPRRPPRSPSPHDSFAERLLPHADSDAAALRGGDRRELLPRRDLSRPESGRCQPGPGVRLRLPQARRPYLHQSQLLLLLRSLRAATSLGPRSHLLPHS